MKLKLLISTLILLVLALVPLSAQETPTAAPFLATNTPTLSMDSVISPTPVRDVSQLERVVATLPERATFEGQRFQIVGFEFERTSRSLNSVTVTVRNISDAPVSGQVWYLLAPPDSSEPWNDAVYAAEAQPIVDLTAQETRAFTFPAPSSDVLGEVRVSAWVHQTEADGSNVHSDGYGYDETLVIAPSVFMTVEHVDFLTTADDNLLFVTLRVRNFSEKVTEVAYSYTLARPDDLTPWETGAFVLPFQPLLLLPGQDMTFTIRSSVPLSEEALQVIGWLQERVGTDMQFRNNDPYP